MKKLKLNLGSINELLSREQMKKINGGYNDAECLLNSCPSGCPTGCACRDAVGDGVQGCWSA